jgi:hypothetical protein
VEALIETLGLRRIGVTTGEYAVSKEGMNMFGIMEIDQGMEGARFALGISCCLGITASAFRRAWRSQDCLGGCGVALCEQERRAA